MANEPFSWTGKVDIDGIEELWTVRANSAQDLQDRRRHAVATISAIRNGATPMAADTPLAGKPLPLASEPPQATKPVPTCSLCGQPAEYKQGISGNPPRKWKAWRCPTHGIINFNQATNTWDPKDAQ